METSPLICRANQLTGFIMIGTSVMKELSPKKVITKMFSMFRPLAQHSAPKSLHLCELECLKLWRGIESRKLYECLDCWGAIKTRKSLYLRVQKYKSYNKKAMVIVKVTLRT